MKRKFEEEHEDDLQDFYSPVNLESYTEDDEISGMEEGFMLGYLQ